MSITKESDTCKKTLRISSALNNYLVQFFVLVKLVIGYNITIINIKYQYV
ncbi:hypothetical protein B0I63_001271 [Clostridium beijerinckii]|uniref:Uncharacterized protein n=1 Tax=Clostridium beijerinckii TaxID=1520 RepID=A0A9Q5GNA3_CLOBE|nr:hypothetical protein CLBIJ_11350 [Clostridium beijerinckii]MBA2888624.1 hypothetical protein [Clostridium beijerinckii]MBA2903355.1 hypothetical protein [Clostridium beijerinckii]MBA2913210.1 hypothetical protein [Clostridium beijerinckii]MBA9016735.1 hypothetical protein [Clostridium beijerinckii]